MANTNEELLRAQNSNDNPTYILLFVDFVLFFLHCITLKIFLVK